MGRVIRIYMLAGIFVALAIPLIAAEYQLEQALVYPCRATKGPLRIDGRLDAAEWVGAIEVSGFCISGSDTLAPEQVVMRLLYDEKNLYVGVKCLESAMDKLKTPTTDRDGAFWNDDSIEIFLDPQHNHETYWQFAITANAVQYDNYKGNSLWNCDWQAATQKAADSWTVEVALPFAGLELPPPKPGALWGFNLCRERQAGGSLELYNWANVQRVFNTVPLFGHLLFVGPEWKATEASISEAVRDVGGKEAIVYIEDGYWRVKAGKPELFPYRALLRDHDQSAAPFITELREVYQKNPKMVLHDEFQKLQIRYDEIKRMVAADSPISVEDWVKATIFLNGLREKVETMCWRVRLTLLNERL